MLEEKLNLEQKIEKQSLPLTASVEWDLLLDTPENQISWLKEFNKLPLFIKLGLCDEMVQERVKKNSQVFNFQADEKKIGEVSRLIREIFTRNIKEREILVRIKEKIGLTGKERQDLYQEIKKIALLVEELGQKEFDLEFEKMPIIPALNTYLEIRSQRITQERIIFGEEKKIIVPSVENWIRDYVEETGSRKHNSLERSRYLFESENAKKLNSTERENLAILLRSYDENYLLVINKVERKLNLEESRKLDENWLDSINFFLGREKKEVFRKEFSLNKNVYLKENSWFNQNNQINKTRKSFSEKRTVNNLKNVLDLSSEN